MTVWVKGVRFASKSIRRMHEIVSLLYNHLLLYSTIIYASTVLH